MKLIYLFLSFLFITNLAAREVGPADYQIISDEFHSDVPNGMIKIIGTVYNQSEFPLTNATIYTLNEQKQAQVDDQGRYEILISTSDKAVFMFAPGFKEILVENYAFKSQHLMVINFYAKSTSQWIEVKEEPIISYKPVIYLYADSPMKVHVDLNYFGDLTFTYPQYNTGWDVSVDENGIKDMASDKSYPYLFWEGEMQGLEYQRNNGEIEGAFLKTDTLVSFLECQLTNLGLNRTEQTDFITFWAPRLQNSPFVFMQFLVDDGYDENIAELNVTPKPDNIKRVYLLFTNHEHTQTLNIKQQEFNGFERNGFTVVEWGGSEIKMNKNEG